MSVSDPLRRELLERRSLYNARFREARFHSPQLDPEVFGAWLHDSVAPVVEAVASVAPDRIAATVESLYALSLSLVARDLVGSKARHPAVNNGWRELLPAAAHLVALEPGGLVPRLVNALIRLAERRARIEDWIAETTAAAPLCATPDDLFQFGRIAAWRAGLPELKPSALAAARVLPPALASIALDLPPNQPVDAAILSRLAADPWLSPAHAAKPPAKRPLRIAAEVGAFRGFGGAFLRPPLVFSSNGELIAFDGETSWLIRADCFGAALFRLKQTDPGTNRQETRSIINRAGRIRFRGAETVLPVLGEYSSAAFNETTLAITLPLSHVVLLVTQVP
jgi:hypothetical protein